MSMILASSFSGGKDSTMACYLAQQKGYRIDFLLNLLSKKYNRCCFHGIQSSLMQDQADAIGITLVQKQMSDSMDTYELEFKAAIKELKIKGVQGVVFGDIYLNEHKDWVERVCSECQIKAIEPLWNMDPLEVVTGFLGYGFKAVIVSCREKLGKEFVGRMLDMEVVNELQKRHMCICGENGEYHTLVVDGPLFQKRIRIDEADPQLREGFWRHWVYNILKYTIEEKKD